MPDRRLSERQFMHRVTHLVLTAYMVVVGIRFLRLGLSDDMMTAEDWLGPFCLTVAFLGIVTISAQGWRWRTVGAIALAAGHASVATYFFEGSYRGPGSGSYFGYALLALCLAYSTAHLSQRISERVEPPNSP